MSRMQFGLIEQNVVPALLLNLPKLVLTDPVKQAVEAEVWFLLGLGSVGGDVSPQKTWTSSVHFPLDRNRQGWACFDGCPCPVGEDLPVEIPTHRAAQRSRADSPAQFDQAAFLLAHFAFIEDVVITLL